MNKICFRCNIEKPIEKYYTAKGMRGGRLNKCADCCKKESNARRYGLKREDILAYDRQRSKRKVFKPSKIYRASNPEKYRAHNLAQRIPMRPCEVCGDTKRIHRHHDDYSKPLEVRFLCSLHHRQYHSRSKNDKSF
jgi:hypothetical protein